MKKINIVLLSLSVLLSSSKTFPLIFNNKSSQTVTVAYYNGWCVDAFGREGINCEDYSSYVQKYKDIPQKTMVNISPIKFKIKKKEFYVSFNGKGDLQFKGATSVAIENKPGGGIRVRGWWGLIPGKWHNL